MRTIPLLYMLACTPEALVLEPDGPPAADPCGDGVCVPAPTDGADGVYGPRLVGWHTVTVDPQGGVWVAWAEVEGPTVVRTLIARSPAPGVLEWPIEVPTIEPPIVGGGERPHLAVSADRVALGYTGAGLLRHGDAHAMYVQLGDRTDAGVRFDDAVRLDDSAGFRYVLEHARVGFAPDGELWALWKRQEYGVSDEVMWAHEDSGWVADPVHPQLSELHDCSPPDFRFGPDGRALLAVRQNLNWVLETVVLTAEPGRAAFDPPALVSANGWQWNDACPEDGPRIAAGADGSLASVWVAPTDDGYRSFYSTSTDAGVSWTPHSFDHGAFEFGEAFPTVAITASGEVWTTAQDLWSQSVAFHRPSLQDEASDPEPLTTPKGHALEEVELLTSGERTVAFGLGEHGALWLLELE